MTVQEYIDIIKSVKPQKVRKKDYSYNKTMVKAMQIYLIDKKLEIEQVYELDFSLLKVNVILNSILFKTNNNNKLSGLVQDALHGGLGIPYLKSYESQVILFMWGASVPGDVLIPLKED